MLMIKVFFFIILNVHVDSPLLFNCIKFYKMVCYSKRAYTRKSYLFNRLFIICESGCANHSVYGTGCVTGCPINCQDSHCHILNGNCFACRPGWEGETCETSTNL